MADPFIKNVNRNRGEQKKKTNCATYVSIRWTSNECFWSVSLCLFVCECVDEIHFEKKNKYIVIMIIVLIKWLKCVHLCMSVSFCRNKLKLCRKIWNESINFLSCENPQPNDDAKWKWTNTKKDNDKDEKFMSIRQCLCDANNMIERRKCKRNVYELAMNNGSKYHVQCRINIYQTIEIKKEKQKKRIYFFKAIQ